MDLDKLKRDLFYKNGEFSLKQTCCLGIIFIFILFAIIGAITPDTNTDTDTNNDDKQMSAYDRMPNEFKDTEKFQILEFENSICAISSSYDLISNKTTEKNFTYSFDYGNLEGIEITFKELDDNSSDINPSDLKEPNYRYVKSENLNVANTPIKVVSFTDTHGGETTNENWVDYTIYTFDKNGKHYQIIDYGPGGLLNQELEDIINSFTKK